MDFNYIYVKLKSINRILKIIVMSSGYLT